jgi:hypothetical protein
MELIQGTQPRRQNLAKWLIIENIPNTRFSRQNFRTTVTPYAFTFI